MFTVWKTLQSHNDVTIAAQRHFYAGSLLCKISAAQFSFPYHDIKRVLFSSQNPEEICNKPNNLPILPFSQYTNTVLNTDYYANFCHSRCYSSMSFTCLSSESMCHPLSSSKDLGHEPRKIPTVLRYLQIVTIVLFSIKVFYVSQEPCSVSIIVFSFAAFKRASKTKAGFQQVTLFLLLQYV